MVPVAGAAMTTTKAATVDLLGSMLDARLAEVLSRITAPNLSVTNGMIFTTCAAAAVKAIVLKMVLAIVLVAVGIKVIDWQ
jgi:multisubunit Na+/H+ antiporter MnhG subunit